jgi:hypothetical protein
MQAAEPFYNLSAVQNAKVIGVGQHDLRACRGDLIGHDALDGSLSSHWHE